MRKNGKYVFIVKNIFVEESQNARDIKGEVVPKSVRDDTPSQGEVRKSPRMFSHRSLQV